ncbi:MAG: hypothetical protein HRT92_02625 [Piscirickettsiaceae bacterium]|nr:hypothetical protein [Piscirickettsiaceae bacterium]
MTCNYSTIENGFLNLIRNACFIIAIAVFTLMIMQLIMVAHLILTKLQEPEISLRMDVKIISI